MTRYLGRWNPVEVEEISPLLVTYRPMRLDEPSPAHLEMLKPVPDLSKVFPEAPNRKVVEQNLLNSVKLFEEALPSFREADTGHRLVTWQDSLRLNIQHATKAERHFSNGQDTVSVVSLDDGRFSLAQHGDEARSHVSPTGCSRRGQSAHSCRTVFRQLTRAA